MRLLLVEDEPEIATTLAESLKRKGYAVDVADDGAKANTRLSMHHSDYDLVLLDLTLPRMNGLDVCREVRAAGVTLPIVILTGKNEEEHKVNLLRAGADDYVVKPFSFDELEARIQAVLRRPAQSVPLILRALDIELDSGKHIATRDGTVLSLTLKEFGLLEYFLRHPNEVVNREDLISHLWDFNYESFSNVVDVHVKNLREKIDQGSSPSILETIRGIGYRLRV